MKLIEFYLTYLFTVTNQYIFEKRFHGFRNINMLPVSFRSLRPTKYRPRPNYYRHSQELTPLTYIFVQVY